MPFYNKCCVETCDQVSKKRHIFPNPTKDMNRFSAWLNNIKSEKLFKMEPLQVYNLKRICEKHFENIYISATSNRLQRTAIPTLHLTSDDIIEDFEIEEQPSCSNTISVPETKFDHTINEHNYSQQAEKSRSPITVRCGTPGRKIVADHVISEHNYSQEADKMHSPITVRCGTPGRKIVAGLSTPYYLLKKAGINRGNMSPRKQKLYRTIKQVYKRYRSERACKQTLQQRLNEAERFQTEHQLEVNTQKLNSMATMLFNLQFREIGKCKKLRRFTMDEKLLALTLYKQSAKSYMLLSKIFILPSKSTLSRLLKEIIGEPGINSVIFESLKETTKNLDNSEKFVAVLFDEMAIMPGLHYNSNLGYIEGFESMDRNRRDYFISDHVLAFMVRGLKSQWKAPISFHFSSRGGAKTPQMKGLLISVIENLMMIGLKPVTVICDQNNMAVIKGLINDTREKYLRANNISFYREGSFEVNKLKIYPIFDPPHLLKGIRNNFVTKNLHFTSNGSQKVAKWGHIIQLYDHCINGPIDGLRSLPNITEEHVIPSKMSRKKMKVKYAAQIFSYRVSSTLQLATRYAENFDEALDTAELLFFFDKLFDSLNGSTKNPEKGKSLRCGLSSTSNHIAFWNDEALPLLQTMFFEKRKPHDQRKPPSLKNWKFTIKNVKSIWNVLRNEGFEYLLTRRLNQDPLENTFGKIRGMGAFNSNPTASQFCAHFKSLFFTSAFLMYKDSFNCENDDCEIAYASFKKLFKRSINVNEKVDIIYENINHKENSTSTSVGHKLHELATSYVAGFVLKKIKKKTTCSFCRNSLFSNEYDMDQNRLISAREYGGDWARRLCYPTFSFVCCFHEILKIINYCLNEKPESAFLLFTMKHLIKENINFDFICCEVQDHKQFLIKYIIKIITTTMLHNWCRGINKILTGKELCRGTNKVKKEAEKIYKNKIKKRTRTV